MGSLLAFGKEKGLHFWLMTPCSLSLPRLLITSPTYGAPSLERSWVKEKVPGPITVTMKGRKELLRIY